MSPVEIATNDRPLSFSETAASAGTGAAAQGATNSREPSRRRMPAFIPADQLYYWSSQWQDSERKAMDDLRAGRARTFDDPTSAVRYLLGSDR